MDEEIEIKREENWMDNGEASFVIERGREGGGGESREREREREIIYTPNLRLRIAAFNWKGSMAALKGAPRE